MMAITHAAIAATGVSLILGSFNPLPLGLAIIGSQLPDIDTSTSLIGQICFPFSSWIEDRYPHRTITHSLLATVAIALPSLLVGLILGKVLFLLALPLGHLISCFSDTFTKKGVQLFWPEPVWCVCGSNPRRRLETGSVTEYWVLVGAIIILLFNLHLVLEGGVVQKAGQSLGLRDSAITMYNEKAANHHVWAEVQGFRKGDRSSVDGDYFVVDLANDEFILLSREGKLYHSGEQLVVKKLTTSVGKEATTRLETLSFNDEEAVEKLLKIQQQSLKGVAFVSGSVAVDFPEEINTPVEGDSLQAITVSGSSVVLNYAKIEEVIAALKGQYVIGTLQVKIVEPKPF